MNLLVKPSGVIQNDQSPPPLGLLYIAAMDEETVVFDATLRSGLFDFISSNRPRIVGVSAYTPGRVASYEVLRHAKKYGATTVIGGPHASVMRKQLETFDYIDYIVMGDGELAWKEIVDGNAKKRVLHMQVADLDSLPLPAWNKVDLKEYDPNTVAVVLGRGCDGDCIFCSTWWVNGKYRAHGREWILKELQILKNAGLRHLKWQDDCLTNDREAAYGLIEALQGFNFQNFGCTRVDKVDYQMLKDLRRVGFYGLSFGIESGSQTVLNTIRKHTDLEQALQVRAWCREVGIRFTALMMRGFPFETPEIIAEDNAFRAKLAPDEWGSMGHIVILPGTKMYNDLRNEGKIDDDFWLGNEPYYRIG